MPNGECDPLSDSFDITVCGTAPPITGSFGFVSSPGTTTNVTVDVTTPPIKVDVSTPATFPQTIIDGVGKVITDALTKLGTTLGNTLSSLNLLTVIAINQAVSGMGQVVADAIKGLGTAISNLQSVNGSALTAIGNAITSGITTAFTTINPHLDGIGTAISGGLGALNTTITTALISNHKSILDGIVPAVTDISTNLGNLHQDLINQIAGIAFIPTAIATGMSSVHDILFTGLSKLGFASDAEITTDLKFPTTPLDPRFIDSFWAPLLSGDAPPGFDSVFGDLLDFTNACEITDVTKAWGTFKLKMLKAPWWLQWLGQTVLDIIAVISSAGALIKQQIELAIQQANKLCPIELLPVHDAIEASLRLFITPAQLKEEMNRHGINDARTAVMLELASQRLDVATIIEAYYRGIMSLVDATLALQALHYTADKISIILTESQYLPTMAEVMHWWRYGVIDEPTFNGFAAVHRVQPLHLQMMKDTRDERAQPMQRIAIDGRLQATKKGYGISNFEGLVPQEAQDAAAREGIGPDQLQLDWVAHYNYPGYHTIIESYYRGHRPLGDVYTALTAENVPQQFQDELVDIARPLLPFRSIPLYVKAGVIDVLSAYKELAKHGFDEQHIAWIFAYIAKSVLKTAPKAAASVATLSQSNARTLFEDGLITRDQYVSVLEAHGYTADLAAAQADADTIAAHIKTHKQTLTDLADEVLVGALTVDAALAQLHQQGFTDVEIARFQKAVRKASISTAKHPTNPEMKTFLKAGLISIDQYRNELQLQGWGDPWLTAFVALETAPPDDGSGSPAPGGGPIGGNPQPQPIPGQGDGTIRA